MLPDTDAGPAELRTILADDDPLARRVIRDTLQAAGITVVAEAANGREAVELAVFYRPDVVLMDYMMPEVDGLEATRRLRRDPALHHIPVVALSASAAVTDARTCLESGADAFLAKPVDLEALLTEIDRLLHLQWDAGPAQAPAAGEPEEDTVVAPPPEELAVLHALARIGNMRSINDRAEVLAAMDPAYGPFATRLRDLARRFQSRAILEWMTALRGGEGGEPGGPA
jgi:CheY-like chemotaxis protein